jgi:hypothetical protein
MITSEEREEIINEAVEKALLVIPTIIMNLMTNYDIVATVNKHFYKEHPNFQIHKDVVSAAVKKIEAENPIEDYEKILNKAVPEIMKQISLLEKVDTKTITNKPNLGLL